MSNKGVRLMPPPFRGKLSPPLTRRRPRQPGSEIDDLIIGKANIAAGKPSNAGDVTASDLLDEVRIGDQAPAHGNEIEVVRAHASGKAGVSLAR